jgi:ribonuclease VapC
VRSCVFDASAALALLLGEPGADRVDMMRAGGIWSTINYAEVLTKLSDVSGSPEGTRLRVDRLELTPIPFDVEQAAIAASLRTVAKPLGLSLADRCCLALALSRQLPVLTGDRKWQKAGLDLEIIPIR